MILTRSKITSQGQISVPSEVRKKLGISPGSTLEWDQDGDRIFVRRAGVYSSEDVNHSLFPKGRPQRHSLEELKEGIRKNMRDRYARD